MKVLHLSTFDTDGGAARGAFWLHDALRAQGVDSTMMVGHKDSDNDSVVRPAGHLARLSVAMRGKMDGLPLRRYNKTDESFWSIGWIPAGIHRAVQQLAPDIVHLHWIGAGFLPLGELKRFECPIVWTLRDMWSFTGGCHYTAGCERFRTGCGRCPQLRSQSEDDLSRSIWTAKRDGWKGIDLSLVPVSGWLGDCARSSPLFASHPIEIIPNGIDVGVFRPTDKLAARKVWNLPADRRILVYGAVNATQDRRKGFPELLKALDILGQSETARDLLVVVFGDLCREDIPANGIETRLVGYIDENERLSQLYSAADAAIMPSLQEAFGKTIVEAMACGTPVVAFASGGPLDIVEHRMDGYLAKPHCPGDLARGMSWCLDEIESGCDLGARARRKVESEFDIRIVAGRYRNLYERLLRRAA